MRHIFPTLCVTAVSAFLVSCHGRSPASTMPTQVGVGSCSTSGTVSLIANVPAGPAVLYDTPTSIPMLENHHPRFTAAPIMVSGHEAYVDGEYLYQDFVYDDHGADTSGQPIEAALTTPATGTATLDALNPSSGDQTYPADFSRYGNNAADLVEFRIAPDTNDVAYRITLNTMLANDATIVAIAWDRDNNTLTGVSTLPRDVGINVEGVEEVIYLWGTGGEHVDTTTSTSTPLTVTTDISTNQMTVFVPRTVHNPTGSWTASVLLGIHDGSQQFAIPGGSTPSSPRVMNMGLRFNELCLALDTPCETQQAIKLREGDISTYRRSIDFSSLASNTNSTTVPSTGHMLRLFASRLDEGEGETIDPNDTGSDIVEYLGQVQPYSLYIPTSYNPANPTKFTLAGHSLDQYYWQYNGSTFIQQVGEARDSIVLTPMGRSQAGFYVGRNEYDVFEAWNDVLLHYNVDMTRVAVTGYSMGGYLTYRFASLYPDLFGKAFTQVGPPSAGIWTGQGNDGSTGGYGVLTNYWLENVRNIPFYNMVVQPDELVPITGARQQTLGDVDVEGSAQSFEGLGYRYKYQEFANGEHFTLFLHDNYPESTAFLGESVVDPNPHHVTFSYVPDTDATALGLIHNKAYWLSGLTLRDLSPGTKAAKGTVDVISSGFGLGQPTTAQLGPTPGSLTGNTGVIAYSETERTWSMPPAIPVENKLVMNLNNLASVQIDAMRANLDLSAVLTMEITADGDGEVFLSGAGFPIGAEVTRDGIKLCGAIIATNGAKIPVESGTFTYMISPPSP